MAKLSKPLFTPTGKVVPPSYGGIPVLASANVPSGTVLMGSTTAPAGPNAVELTLVSYDPDSQIVDVRLPKGVEAQVNLSDPNVKATIFDVALGDGKLAAKVEIRVIPARKPPKFNSVEEAEAWMSENG